MSLKNILVLASTYVCLCAGLTAFTVDARAQSGVDNEVVGIVNRKAITRYDILEDLRKREVEMDKMPASEQQRVFTQALTSRVLDIVNEEASKRSGISISEEDYVNIKTRTIEAQFGGEVGFTQFLREQSMTEEDWDTDFRKRQEMFAYLRVVSGRGGARLSRDLRPLYDLTIRPQEIRDFYLKNKDTEFTFQDEAEVRVIQVYFSRNVAGAEARAKQLLLGLKQKLKTKADFAVLAEKNSEHTSRSEGGLIGSVVKGKGTILPEIVEEAVFAPDAVAGSILGPILNVNSYWLIKIEKRQEARVLGFEEAQELIRRQLYTDKSNRILLKVRLDLVKEAYISPPDLRRRVVGALELELSR